jgi:hypothetical protein
MAITEFRVVSWIAYVNPTPAQTSQKLLAGLTAPEIQEEKVKSGHRSALVRG